MTRLHRNQTGITLIELVIVAVMVSLLAAMAAPQWLDYIPQLRTKAAVRDAVSRLREARSLAVAEKIPYGVYFDVNQREFILFADTQNPEQATYSMGDSLVKTSPVGAAVSIGSTTFPAGAVVFNANGAASLSGTVTFNSADYQTIYTVDVLAATGRVRMVEGYL